MGFYIRKSVGFGPIRFNLSKSGVGVSFGVKGARLSTGPRGTYVNMGSHGIYYRQKINGSIESQSTSPSEDTGKNFNNASGKVEVNIDNLVESSSKDLLDKINSRIRQPKYALLVGFISTLIAGGILLFGSIIQNLQSVFSFVWLFFYGIAGIFWITGLWVAWVTSQQEKLSQTTTLKYTLDEKAKQNFISVQATLENLSKSARIWLLTSKVDTFDWKRNAGASSLISRSRAIVKQIAPPFIQTRIKVFSLSLNSIQLFFLPDQIFVFQNGKYGAVSYGSLKIDEMPTRFIEDETVPSDSHIVDNTWQYVRKDGGPDLRFKNNRQLPIVQYGYVEISSSTGLRLRFYVSNLKYANQFTQTLVNYSKYSQSPDFASPNKSSSNQQNQSQHKVPAKPESENPYVVLGVQAGASLDEISSAYRRLAQMYHPDKVATLAPEYKEISEKRMKSINFAYNEIKRKFEQK